MKLVVLGANGQMGQLVTRLFAPYFQILSFDQADWPQALHFFDEADFICLAVSMQHTGSVIDHLEPYLKPRHALWDITSIKSPVIHKMLNIHRGPVLGTHPIFGPGIATHEWPWVICPGRDEAAFKPIVKAIAGLGFTRHHMSGAEHDLAMDMIQGVNYAVLRAYVESVGESIWRQSAYGDLIEHFLTEDPKLYESIITATAERITYIHDFAQQGLSQLEQFGKKGACTADYESVSSTLTLLEAMQPGFNSVRTAAIASPNFKFKQAVAHRLSLEKVPLIDAPLVRKILNQLLQI